VAVSPGIEKAIEKETRRRRKIGKGREM